MKFTLVIYAAPYSSEAPATALRFAKALLDAEHEIYRLFFYSDGVHNASGLAVVPQDEPNLQRRWHELIRNYELDSVVCVTSAIKRGIINRQEAERHELGATSMLASSEIAGLGQWVDAALNSDRVIHFG